MVTGRRAGRGYVASSKVAGASTSLVGLKWVSGATKGLPSPRFAVLLFLVNFSVLPRLPSGMLIMV